MRLLHTSDWHLGRTLYGRKRYEEQAAFLDWLIDTIREKHVDTLIVAGDIFDTSTPSNRAQELYYSFSRVFPPQRAGTPLSSPAITIRQLSRCSGKFAESNAFMSWARQVPIRPMNVCFLPIETGSRRRWSAPYRTCVTVMSGEPPPARQSPTRIGN